MRDAGPRPPAQDVVLTGALGSDAMTLTTAKVLCVPSTVAPCARLDFEVGGGSPACGGTSLTPPPAPPYAGRVYDAPSGGSLIAPLGAGCLTFGGGDGDYYASLPTLSAPAFSFETTSCPGDTLLMQAAADAPGSCLIGPSDRRLCLNDTTRACTGDADCARPGACQRAPRCFAGPPTPFRSYLGSNPIGTCLVRPVTGDATASVTSSTGQFTVTTPSRTLVYLTFDYTRPCPVCLGGTCEGGQRDGKPCVSSGNLENTSLDCPPAEGTFFQAIDSGPFTASTTARSMAAADGLFCPDQENPGAFGVPAVRRIELTGIPAGDLSDGAAHPATLLDLVCVAATGNSAVDNLADFPGPQAQSIAGTVRLTR